MSVYDIATPYPPDIRGWHSTEPIFGELIEKVSPSTIVEVGTWKGASAIHMGKECERLNLPTKIICVDTWLGAAEFYADKSDEIRYGSLRLVDGYPRVYYQFLSNVIHSNQTDRITPLPLPSLVAAQVLKKEGVTPELIYLDASHSFEDVFMDLTAWWGVLSPSGIIFGDDFDPTWKTLQKAVMTFSKINGVPYTLHGRFWVMQKSGEVKSLEELLDALKG